MKIKITFSLNGMYNSRETDLPAHFGEADGTEFVLWMREVGQQDLPERQLCCDIVSDITPPSRARETLLALKEGRLLLDDPIQEGLPNKSLIAGTIVDLQGNVKPNNIVPFELLPKGAKPWISKTYADQSKKLKNFLKLLRWVQNTAGGHRPFAVVGAFWSLDGEDWSRFPSEIRANISVPRPIEASAFASAQIAKLMKSCAQEPISHDLMREANELAWIAPRSALLVAFAALEAGIKLQLTRIIPDASTLIDKMPSPPLLTLLRDVLPEIIKDKGLPADHFPLNKPVKDYINKWVSQRNQVTHGTKHSVDAEKVVEFIRFAKDILYLLDHIDGQSWALEHLESKLWTDDGSVC